MLPLIFRFDVFFCAALFFFLSRYFRQLIAPLCRRRFLSLSTFDYAAFLAVATRCFLSLGTHSHRSPFIAMLIFRCCRLRFTAAFAVFLSLDFFRYFSRLSLLSLRHAADFRLLMPPSIFA